MKCAFPCGICGDFPPDGAAGICDGPDGHNGDDHLCASCRSVHARARATVHAAIRRAGERGCANLPACAFGGKFETYLCDELVVAMLEFATQTPEPTT